MGDRVQKSGCFIGGPLVAEHLFAGLPRHALEAFSKLRRRRLFQKGVPIASPGTPVKNICILCSGSAVIRVHSGSGTTVVREVVPNELLGITEAMSHSPFEYEILTTQPCFIDLIDAEDFGSFMTSQPEFCFRLFKDLGTNLQRSYLAFSSTSSDEDAA